MTPLDLTAGAVLIFSALIGLRKGLLQVLVGLAAWAGALVTTFVGFRFVRPYAREWVGEDSMGDLVGAVLLFIAAIVILKLALQMILGGLGRGPLGPVNRVLGLALGFAIGMAIVSGGYIASQRMLNLTDQDEFYRGARLLPLIKRGAEILEREIQSDPK